MRKASMITKCALAALDRVNWIGRVDFPLSLTDFGLVTVLAHDLFEKLHDITRHGFPPLRNALGLS